MRNAVIALLGVILLTAGMLALLPGTAFAPPTLFPDWYLAEGSNAWGFSTQINIENPNATPVNCDVSFMTPSGPIPGPAVFCPARSMNTLLSSELPAGQDFSTFVHCSEGLTIAVERTVYWPGPSPYVYDEHSSVGVTQPGLNWFLPEGSSAWGFECWLVIQNPYATDATCQVTYMIEDETAQVRTKLVPAHSRRSYSMADDIGAKDASIRVQSDVPVIPERAMYRNGRRAGHESIGAREAAQDYFLAEGTTAWGYTTYICIQNPNPTATDVTITYMTPGGPSVQPTFSLPANSRETLRANDTMPDTDLSTQVHGSQPIVAERAMYWDGGGGFGEATHDSIGTPWTHRAWYLPNGRANWRPTYSEITYTTVQNPNLTPVDITVSYLRPNGTDNVTFSDTLAARSRSTYRLNDRLPAGGSASIEVVSDTPGGYVISECVTYWTPGFIGLVGGTCTIGGFSD
jgi:hypothetical protein